MNLKTKIDFIHFTISLLGFLAFSFIAAETNASALPTPYNLTAKTLSSSEIHLTWICTSNSIVDGFSIERSTNSTTGYTKVASTGANTKFWKDSGLKSATRYFYRVRSFDQRKISYVYSSYSTRSSTVTNQVSADVTAPTVSITNPQSGATYTSSQTLQIAVTAQDNVAVTKVELFNGSILMGTDSAAPYSFSFPITESINGSHSLTAKAYDAAGNSRVSGPVSLKINIAPKDTIPPAVSITNPSGNTTITSAQTLNLVASASDNTAVSKVEFYNGSTLMGTDTTNTFSAAMAITAANNGTHTITAVAYDAAGNVGKSIPVTVTVNIATLPTTYSAPVLDYVQASGTDFMLGWSQPATAYGVPAGGYDIVIDGVDTNAQHNTGQVTKIIGGLAAGTHCFQIEARWTQADPSQFPRSNQVCATLEETASSEPAASDPEPEQRPDGSLPVFPGAQGFGAGTKAGRSGQILR
ncbi:MAG: fibronectin type III domain-containing protein, partial [Deltaproteobacteria bacterium]|nr:fibronectin type III domain-containing protein [Deltaproteobacteria bacterium]